jgi:hypothetical protein
MQVDARSIECEASVRRPPAEEKSPPANGVMLQADRKGRQGKTSMIRLTPIAKYSVSAIEPKYAAVKGRRGPETRCFAYTQGPMRTAHESRKRSDPTDHLIGKTGLISPRILERLGRRWGA